jgi:hypothetical protein
MFLTKKDFTLIFAKNFPFKKLFYLDRQKYLFKKETIKNGNFFEIYDNILF